MQLANVKDAADFLDHFECSVTPERVAELLKDENFLRVVRPFTFGHSQTPKQYKALFAVVPEIEI